MHRKLVAMAGLAVLVIGFGFALGRAPRDPAIGDRAPLALVTSSPRPQAGAVRPAAQSEPVASARVSAEVAPQRPTEVLAALDEMAPLAPAYARLAAAARAGDAAAAMTLFGVLAMCETSDRDTYAGAPAPRDTADAIGRLPTQIRECHARRRCRSLDAEQRRDPLQWLLMAAEAGRASARIQFASGLMFVSPGIDTLGHVARYRQVAHAWMREGAQQGSVVALEALAMMHSTPPGAGGRFDGLAPYDPALALAYLRLSQERSRFGADQAQALRRRDALSSSLSAAQLQEAEAALIGLRQGLPHLPPTAGPDAEMFASAGLPAHDWNDRRAACLAPAELALWKSQGRRETPR